MAFADLQLKPAVIKQNAAAQASERRFNINAACPFDPMTYRLNVLAISVMFIVTISIIPVISLARLSPPIIISNIRNSPNIANLISTVLMSARNLGQNQHHEPGIICTIRARATTITKPCAEVCASQRRP